MGVPMSTLAGWAFVICVAGYYALPYISEQQKRRLARGATRPRPEDRQIQNRKDTKDKAKRHRVEAYSKDVEDTDKGAKPKSRAPKPASASASAQSVSYSSDDGVDNREFARQLAAAKQGTNLNAAKKNEEKRQKSVKQSRAREEKAEDSKASAPSSNAGADADDDESPIASPEMQAADVAGISDMLEPEASGPSVLRLTDTDKVKQKEKKAKAPEKAETKKQRQNRQKAEAAKLERRETEKQRQVALEAQRRLARISEGRAAKDGSAFMAAAAKPAQSVWTGNGNGINSSSNSSVTNGDYVPVQPLDTFDTSSHTDVSLPQESTPPAKKGENWISSLPSEEEQLEILRGEEAWSTVKTKKAGKTKKKDAQGFDSANESESAAAVPATSQPIVAKAPKSNGTRPTVSFSQKSSFAALSTNDEPEEVEKEWDI
ncbi:hypothetical protein B0H66DRAFT_47321 [Apodospora peruviana]|uniref:Uncharacterized protein n=1 Tax=Apodospora peruviana TaxID=516989 RepID=A0AAE0ISD8_9PEZI|nr:hypothetical protein B0H66DRAFT_47321 [Apodospora peruviana]